MVLNQANIGEPFDLDDEAVRAARIALGDGAQARDRLDPVLHYLLLRPGPDVFNDAVLARTNALLADMAWRLLSVGGEDEVEAGGRAPLDLARRLARQPELAGFCHALAVEEQVANRLAGDAGIDPVLSPLVQNLIASDDPTVSSLAMSALTAQTRASQWLRRGEMPLAELPADLMTLALTVRREHLGGEGREQAASAEAQLRAQHDDGATRVALFDRLATALGPPGVMDLAHAGVPLFIAMLAQRARLPRRRATMLLTTSQRATLAVALRAAGLKRRQIARQLLILGPQLPLPDFLSRLRRQDARLLALSSDGAGPP